MLQTLSLIPLLATMGWGKGQSAGLDPCEVRVAAKPSTTRSQRPSDMYASSSDAPSALATVHRTKPLATAHRTMHYLLVPACNIASIARYESHCHAPVPSARCVPSRPPLPPENDTSKPCNNTDAYEPQELPCQAIAAPRRAETRAPAMTEELRQPAVVWGLGQWRSKLQKASRTKAVLKQ